ncbi:DNA-binding response regulator, OmpR family, contains REC and winged-helix (wHTH) domain [Paenibacillus catalpae]|uniref:DNA-binding response regulator, OmpR family, contains REC and winged-helix (WHTH) domain n=1 Tax=Paenibacillus catalpae TaxID=1045775 RepID=A0A1I2FTP7_9BACL|nr:response regulator transcription factor [Paenibacillus catalpae]SFF08695.1 DNA-binding response regulator, OmpR family, contains REC and winged-helix (wHTH) domain [Paenibacillus catalpae]
MSDKIMVIEDEKKIADAIAYALKREGYLVDVVNRGDTALERLPLFQPDALILDVMLPGTDGYEILKKLREKGRRIGVIMLTAKEDIVHKVLGLELGADDYITKPFDMRELLARLKSLLRRMQAAEEKQEATEISLGEVVLKLNKRTAFVGTRALDLTPKEYDLLTLLLSRPDQVFSREQLLDQVWGLEYIGGTRTVDIHVQRLRKKLGEEFGKMIQTVHGVGYKILGGYSEN